jgi:hypothetical protein
MTADAPSRFAVILTWAAVVISVTLVMLGIYWYGLSLEVQGRLWSNIFERAGGPMSFRFILQPTVAFLAALHDGIRDVRHGHKAFFWSVRGNDPTQQAGRLREGLTSVSRVILLGLSMDVIYQFKELDQFYPAEAVMMALLLAVIPYFIFRWIVEHVARWWRERSTGSAS